MMYGASYFICEMYLLLFTEQLRLNVFCQRFVFCDMYLLLYNRATQALMMYGASYFICEMYLLPFTIVGPCFYRATQAESVLPKICIL